MDVTGTAEPLTGGRSPGSVFPRVMHQDDREVKPPLKGTKIGQQPGHFAGVIFVDSMKSHQGIEKKEPGPESLGCLEQPRAVRIAVEYPAKTPAEHRRSLEFFSRVP